MLDRNKMPLSSVAESLLFVAARAQLMAEKIKPSLERNQFVICDRYTDSTVAYQGYGRGLNVEYLEELNKFATDSIQPDITIILDIDPKKAAIRMASDVQDRLESTGINFFLRVREGYYEIARRYPQRCVIIDGLQSVHEVFNSIMNEVNNKLINTISCNSINE